MNDLLPCPFCGGHAKTKLPYVRCTGCGAQMCFGETDADDSAISSWNRRAALSQQRAVPDDAHCATCTCVPGMTPAVRFDASPAEREGVIREHLISMGWTPPGEDAPPAQDCPQCGCVDDGKCLCAPAAQGFDADKCWKFVEQAFDTAKTSACRRILQDLGLPDDEAHMPLSWHIDRALAAAPSPEDSST